ncbi:MAG: glycosyltransferase family 2 protein [Planctomycetes bacterium]|nr:glycosyltransferase family 2 protein [Planctomycetota bacterium]
MARISAVSAVVCNYNGESYLAGCLESVLAQGVDEVLVVDDASSDGSVALVRARFPRVQVIRLEKNSGPCAARNAGMRAARNRWVLAVDNDAVLEPDVLAKLRSSLETRPEVCLAQPRSVLFDEPTRVHYDGGGFHYLGLIALRNAYTPLAEAEGVGVVEADALVAICALLDREVVLGLGGYDEELFYLAEDLDLSLRLKLAGERLVSVEEALVRHRGGTAGLSFRGGGYPRRRVYLHARNRRRILLKCYRARTLLLVLPAFALYELVWLLFALKQGELGAVIRGRFDFLRALPSTLRARRVVQARRRLRDRELLCGGPLVLSPSLVASGGTRGAARLLDRCFRAWWWLVRPLCG